MTASATIRVEELAIFGAIVLPGPARIDTHRTRQTEIIGVWLPGQAGLARAIRHRVGRIVWIAGTVEALSSGRNVGVGESFVGIVVHASGHLLSRLSRREIRCTRA